MISHLESHKLNSLLGAFKNASLINGKGELIFSKDGDSFKTTTSRLVLFQISKKYLSPKVGDIIISNDPENGGTSLSRIYFISCLHENLFLIWDAEFYQIDFKIPLIPLVEHGKINAVMWDLLVESRPCNSTLSIFLKKQFSHFQNVGKFKKFVQTLSGESFQRSWFGICKEIFMTHFESKSFGQNDITYKFKQNTQIKIQTSADQKQKINLFKIDFSGTTLVDPQRSKFSCASHVVESGLIIEFSKFYNLEKFLSQPVLDHVKLILPPRSTVTTAGLTGEYNFELQKIIRQMMRYNLNHINSQGKKIDKKFSLYSTHLLQMTNGETTSSIFLSNSRIEFKNIEDFEQRQLQNVDSDYKAVLILSTDQPVSVSVTGISSTEDQSKRWLKINDALVEHGKYQMSKGDRLSFNWKI